MKRLNQAASSIAMLIAISNVNTHAFTAQPYIGAAKALPCRLTHKARFPPCSTNSFWKISMSTDTAQEPSTDYLDEEKWEKEAILAQEELSEYLDEKLQAECIAEACIAEDFEVEEKECKPSFIGELWCRITNKNRVEKTLGTVFFLGLDHILRKIFHAKGITFPSMMGGCVLLFSFLVMSEVVRPGAGDAMFEKLSPSANLLAKWLPVMFVPGLIMMPLAPKIGSSIEVAKVMSVVVLGFFFTLFTTAYSVLGLRTLQGKIEKSSQPTIELPEVTKDFNKNKVRNKPYSDITLRNLNVGAVVFGSVTAYLTKIGHPLLVPVRTLFMLCTTVGSFVFGANLSPRITAFIHPLLTSTAFTLLVVNLFGMLTGSTFTSVLKAYKVSSLCPLHTGAGDLLLYMLGPAVCSLSVAMYSRKKLMKENLPAVLLAMVVTSVGALFSSALYASAMNFPGEILRLSVLTRAVTTALNIELTQILGGNVPIAVSIVVLNGIFGASIGARVMNRLKIRDPVSRGLGMGGGAQGLGVASLLKEKDALPFAAINMILSALFTSVLISCPALRETIKGIALVGV